MNAPRLLVAPSHTWAEFAATRITELIVSCLRGVPERHVFVALAGGSTPAPVYEALAASTTPIDWSRVELFLSDERMVALDDADSNFRTARFHLTDRIAGQHPLLHPVTTELDVHSAARAYDKLIRQRLPGEPSQWPRFDLILLGIGMDGHTASLFPDEPALGEHDHGVVGAMHPQTGQRRTTFTLPLLGAAQEVWFLVTGSDKSDIVARAIRSPRTYSLPASVVAQSGAHVRWILADAAATGVIRS